jgi:putative transcriptional regulator
VKDADTTKKTPAKHDWKHFNMMTAAERHDAALSDPDAQPITPDNVKRIKRTPQVKVIRRALGLMACFHIPLGTLRDWEQNRKEPDAAARAYLTVIARNPEAVSDALQPTP